MERFSSISKLNDKIYNDIKYDDLSFVRIISVDTFSDFIELNKTILGSCHHINLSKFCKNKDTIPFMTGVHDAIESIDVDTVLLPLSEHLRINNSDINAEIQRILEKKLKESSPNKRIRLYIPMYRMKDQLESLIKIDKRFDKLIYFLDNPVKFDDYSLTIISSNYDINVSSGKKIDCYQEYLKYWEDNPAQPIVLLSKMAKFYRLKNYIDNVKVYISAFEILSHLNIINDRIKESYADEQVWKNILDNCKGDLNIVKMLSLRLNVKGIDLWDIYPTSSSFIDNENKYRWILLNSIDCKGYASMAIIKSNNSEDLWSNLVLQLFDIQPQDRNFWQLYLERKNILRRVGVSLLPEKFWEILKRLKMTEQIYYLTDNTSAEKERILQIVSEQHGIKDSVLSKIYFNLYSYSQDYEFDNSLISEYFSEYKKLKLHNEITDEFNDLVNEYAKEKGKWLKLQLNNRNEIISNMYQNNSCIVWFDGLGVEYLAFIKEYISINYPSIFIDAKVAYANIPTITDENKDFTKDRKVILINRDLDKMKHITDYPIALPLELEIITKQIDEIMEIISSYDRILIVSDHGFTRLFKLANLPSLPVKETAEVKRCGRYCIDSSNYGNTPNYSGCVDDDNIHCFANYNRFKCSMNLQGEVHGGATLEEVLVPIITLSTSEIERKIKIESIEDEYSGKIGDVIKIEFKVSGIKPEILFANAYQCTLTDKQLFTFDYVIEKEGINNFSIKHIGKVIGRLSILVKLRKGISSKFDI